MCDAIRWEVALFVSVLVIEIKGMLCISLVAVMLQWWLVDD